MPKNQPPKLALRFFRWFCNPELTKYIEGDLFEIYKERLQSHGVRHANRRFVRDVLFLFRPGIIRPFQLPFQLFQFDMFRNHFKIGLRSLWKDRFYTVINLFGLSMGLAFSFLVLLLVRHEFSYEDFYEQRSNIYRLGLHNNIGGQLTSYGNAPRPLAPNMKAEFPGIEAYTRMRGVTNLEEHEGYFEYEQEYYYSNKAYVVDSTFFSVLGTKLLRGDKSTVLNRPGTVALSTVMAQAIFGDEDPIGKEIQMAHNGKRLEVTGIFEPVPANTHIPYDVLVSWNNYYDPASNIRWYGRHVYTYVLLSEPSQAEVLKAGFPDFFEKYMSAEYNFVDGQASLIVQPIEDIHLYSKLAWEPTKNADIGSVYILLAIGVFLVIIAEVNYLNLSLARSSLRKKEISVRKVIGATKWNISSQFVVETLLFTFASFLTALAIVRLIYSEFLSLSEVDVAPFSSNNLLLFAAVTFVLGLVVSLYPSAVLSSIRLVEGLKGKSKRTRGSGKLQRALVILQFAISTIVILFTFVVQKQLNYLLNKNLGFDKENVVVFQLEDSVLSNRVGLLKEQIASMPAVVSVAFSENRPGVNLNHTNVHVEDNGQYNAVGSAFMIVDHDFEAALGLEISEGRSFIKNSQLDASQSIIINEAARKKFGWGEKAVGKKLHFGGDEPFLVTTVGVFKDFNVGSLHEDIEPIVIFYSPNRGNQLLVRLGSENQRETITAITDMLNDYGPRLPVYHEFLDVELDRLYSREEKLSQFMSYLSGITIVVSVLGFIGLLSYAITQRQKEIGVRKVLGAGVKDVTVLFYKQILLLIVVAQVLAFPINYYLSTNWLNSFQYRAFPSILEFGVIMLLILVVSLVTLGFQVIKASLMNPVDVIQDE